MANPQRENGHTQINHETMEAILDHAFSLLELKVILCVLRKTWGWDKKEDFISNGQIAKATNIARRHVIETISKLVTKNVLLVTKKALGNVTVNLIKFNKDHESWGSAESVTTSDQKSTRVVTKKALEVVPIQSPTKEKKETIQKKVVLRTTANADKRNPVIEELLTYWQTLFGPTKFIQQDRFALSNLLKAKYLEELLMGLEPAERVKRLMELAQKMATDRYSVRIASPADLQYKFNQLKMQVIKKKGDNGRVVKVR